MASIDPSPGSRAGAVVGAFIGAFFGSGVGIAAFGTAISGMVPIGLVGAWLGYRYRKPVVPDAVEVSKAGGALVKHALVLALDLLVLFLLFIRKTLQRPNQGDLEDPQVK